MPSFLSFALKYRVYLILALIVCGPVLLLPHTLPVFAFIVGLDSILSLVAGAIFAVATIFAHLAPEPFKEAAVKHVETVLGRTRAQKMILFCYRLVAYSNTALLVLTSHPYFAFAGLCTHVVLACYNRVLAKIHAA